MTSFSDVWWPFSYLNSEAFIELSKNWDTLGWCGKRMVEKKDFAYVFFVLMLTSQLMQ